MRAIGRLLQFLGLVILPLSMVLEVGDFLGRPFGVSDMVVMLLFGIACFCAGRIVEGYGVRE